MTRSAKCSFLTAAVARWSDFTDSGDNFSEVTAPFCSLEEETDSSASLVSSTLLLVKWRERMEPLLIFCAVMVSSSRCFP